MKHLNNLITLDTISCFSDSKFQDMSYTNFLIIDHLYDHQNEDTTQKDIETQMVMSRSTTSKMLKLMEKKGFIKRSDSISDSRTKIITLLPKGLAYHKANVEKNLELERYFNQILTEEEIQYFNSIYEKLRKAHSK